jgi:hypothetical protein
MAGRAAATLAGMDWKRNANDGRDGTGNRRQGRGFPWIRASLFVAVCSLAVLLFTPLAGKIKRGLKEILAPKPVVLTADEEDIRRQVEARLRSEFEQDLERQLEELRQAMAAEATTTEDSPAPAPAASPALGSVRDVRQLRSGIPFRTEIEVLEGGIASVERVDPDSYTATYRLELRVPAPAKTIDQLETSNPQLSKILPGLPGLLETGEVSPWFFKLYENKTTRIRRDAHSLNEVLTKHNLYDCETILHLQAANGRRVFFLQAEMDVVSDGSDGDRLPTMPDEIVNSTHYQPFTSYGWPKRTRTPNPMLAGWERRIGNAQKELADPATTVDRKTWLRDRIEYLKRGVADLKGRSFLIAEYDPFIVIPMNLLTVANEPFAPRAGDYAAVIYGDQIYPCIVGDAGPTFKVGEASLRMAREINSRSSPYSRPVSDLKVSYVVFPNSREERREPPDFAKWRERCLELINEIGGLGEGFELHEWEDLLAPKPEPEPAAESEPAEVPEPAAVEAAARPAE